MKKFTENDLLARVFILQSLSPPQPL